jgi:hypothetical protein
VEPNWVLEIDDAPGPIQNLSFCGTPFYIAVDDKIYEYDSGPDWELFRYDAPGEITGLGIYGCASVYVAAP